MTPSASVTVVGSGPSGVHFALTLLRRGLTVTMVDGGRPPSPAPHAHDSLAELRTHLDDPSEYFLGGRFEGVLLRRDADEYYGIPPHKQYLFAAPSDWKYSATGFSPLFSFAQGGLAEAWTGGCYPFNDSELERFPFSYDEIGPCYDEVAARIGISGLRGDLDRFMPLHRNLQPPLDLDTSSAQILAAYERRKQRLNQRLGFFLGRSRVATLTRRMGDREPCSYLGRCLWGCPTASLYTPSVTLDECRSFDNFTYVPGLQVRYFRYDEERRITALVVSPLEGGEKRDIPVRHLVLAAGTLSTTKIVLESHYRHTGEVVRLGGLMDNRQALVPLTNLRMIGRSFAPKSYQYNLLCLGVANPDPDEYVHGLLTTLTTAMIHPIAQQLPFDLGTSTYLTRALRASLGLINLNFRDTRRAENQVWVEPGGDDAPATLAVEYQPDAGEPERVRDAMKIVRRALWRLGCLVPPGMAHLRRMGASVHYAGTLPMTRDDAPWTTRWDGSSRDFRNLHIADGATFPFLPAKNLTFTLMANAIRIAGVAF